MTESVNGASLTGPTATGTLTDSTGEVWSLTNGVVSVNGQPTASANVILLEYVNSVIFQQNNLKLWWMWKNGAWSPVNAPPVVTPPVPPPPTQSITLSPGQSISITFPAGGTVVFTAS